MIRKVFLMALMAGLTIATAALPSRSWAQSIGYQVKVAGYSSTGWIEVRDGRNVGGKVVRDQSGAWTDRVSRGEELRVTITDGRGGSCEVKDAIVGVVADNGFVRASIVNLPFQREFVVSRDPSFDNVIVAVINRADGRLITRRVPIGTR